MEMNRKSTKFNFCQSYLVAIFVVLKDMGGFRASKIELCYALFQQNMT